jgi:hypothetical protein
LILQLEEGREFRVQIELETSENFGDIFEVVKRSVKQQLGMERAGLMLVLADLPMQLGAFHGVGTNQIVMNRALLDRIVAAGHPRSHINAFVYSILLHEYLHSLGIIDESEVRRLVNEISLSTFGPDHPASSIASKGPWSLLREVGFVDTHVPEQTSMDLKQSRVELVSDFDRSHRSYIS